MTKYKYKGWTLEPKDDQHLIDLKNYVDNLGVVKAQADAIKADPDFKEV